MHLLLTRLQEAEDEREKRRLAYEGAQLLGRVDWLVNALLKISKIDAGTAVFAKERVDAEALVEKALKPLSIPMELREQAVVREMEDGAGFTGDVSRNPIPLSFNPKVSFHSYQSKSYQLSYLHHAFIKPHGEGA